jgi:transketolase
MTASTATTFDCRDAYSRTLLELATDDDRIVAVVNDSVGSSKLAQFKQRFPDRLIDVGIAEANMVGVAAGLANAGRIPFVSGAASFLSARALEQIKVDVAYSRANVKLCAMSPGVAYGQLGATHHSIEDLAWLRAIPEIAVVVPVDPVETEGAVRAAAVHDGPVYLRVSRTPVPVVLPPDHTFELGRAVQLRDGDDLTIVANGIMVARALESARLLSDQDGVEAGVLAHSTLRPLDTEAIISAAHTTGAIVTVEEHSTHGGLGSAIAETLVEHYPIPMRLLGIPDAFAPTGSTDWLLEHYGLTPEGIREAVLTVLRRKRAP